MSKDDARNERETAEFIPLARRAAQFYETGPKVRAQVEVAGRTHPGKVRENNEDNYIAVRRYRGRKVLVSSIPEEIFDPSEEHAYTFAVADGLGGCNFGELASLLAMRTGWDLGGNEIKWAMKMNEEEVEEMRQKAETFFHLIDETLRAEVRRYPRLAGMGTTLTVCYSSGPELFVMNVGDSRAYLYRHGALQRLTRDHTLGQLLVDSGKAEPDSVEVRRMRHVLTNVLGGPGKAVSVDIHHQKLQDNDSLLLCTDGLTDMVGDDDIAALLARHPNLTDASSALVDLALENGGKDNVTVLLARYQIEDGPVDADEPGATLPG